MRRIFSLLAAVMFTSVMGHAQGVAASESWSGVIDFGMGKLNIGFVIRTMDDGSQQCTMDVPDQNIKDFPVGLVENSAERLRIAITALNASYEGRRVSSEHIEGLFTQNGASFTLNLSPGDCARQRRPQTPTPPFAYRSEEVTFANETEGSILSGTLTYPVNYDSCAAGSVPVVLMVTGSGAQDRDETIYAHKPFWVIADHLARHGIATLRYDDRGVGGSTGPVAGMTTESNRADAAAGVAYLRGLDKFGKVGVLGHSEGGTIAFMMGADGGVDFIISLAGTAAPGVDVIIGQNRALLQQQGLPQTWIDDYAHALSILYKDRVDGVAIVNGKSYVDELCRSNDLSLPEVLKDNLVQCITAGGEWFTWFLGYDPAEAISRVSCPVMALNGNLDLQVLCHDNLPVIEACLPHNDKSMVKEYDGLNHLFQHCTLATAFSYGAIEETIAEEVLVDIVDWINRIK